MSKVLKLARIFHGKTQAEVASALGIAKSSISEIESGKRPLSLQTIRRYAQLVGIPASSLMFFMEEIDGEYVPAEHGRLQETAIKLFEWMRKRAQLPDGCESDDPEQEAERSALSDDP